MLREWFSICATQTRKSDWDGLWKVFRPPTLKFSHCCAQKGYKILRIFADDNANRNRPTTKPHQWWRQRFEFVLLWHFSGNIAHIVLKKNARRFTTFINSASAQIRKIIIEEEEKKSDSVGAALIGFATSIAWINQRRSPMRIKSSDGVEEERTKFKFS